MSEISAKVSIEKRHWVTAIVFGVAIIISYLVGKVRGIEHGRANVSIYPGDYAGF